MVTFFSRAYIRKRV